MKVWQNLLRSFAGIGMLFLSFQLTPVFDGIEITAPGLVIAVAILLSFRLFFKGIFGLIMPDARTVTTMRPSLDRIYKGHQKRAQHEAAHAVVAYALGHRVLSASIVSQGMIGGRVAWRHHSDVLASVDHIAVTFAGPLAEGTGDVIEQGIQYTDDYSALLRTAIAASITDQAQRTPTQIIDDGTRLARCLVEDHAGAIEAVAAALLSTEAKHDLEEGELRELMERHSVRPDITRESR
ncbi:hypothetical protein [Psychromicrobium sp. YIM B11713]|uniref:hypothetical protein n=1 Tax=Psychromicrobium sp. YIM B11713 TaxID=3145233 RepID=UPI00374EB57F